MDIHPVVVGIDVCKARLDIFDGRASACANTAEAIGPLAARWAETGVHVVFEATGGCDRTLRRALGEAGVAYTRVNPGRARDFARAAGYLAKTDQVDARMLARLGQALAPRTDTPVDPAREKLAALHGRRDQLVHARQQERTRLHGVDDPEVREGVEAHLAWLDGAITALDRRLRETVRASAALAKAERLLRSVPGIGPVAAVTLLALVPELGRIGGKAVAALVGLAPINRDSGLHRGRRTIGGGRKRPRDALYMAALSATRSHSRFAGRYDHLLAAGKPPKLALVALARQILVTANAVLRDEKAFQR